MIGFLYISASAQSVYTREYMGYTEGNINYMPFVSESQRRALMSGEMSYAELAQSIAALRQTYGQRLATYQTATTRFEAYERQLGQT